MFCVRKPWSHVIGAGALTDATTQPGPGDKSPARAMEAEKGLQCQIVHEATWWGFHAVFGASVSRKCYMRHQKGPREPHGCPMPCVARGVPLEPRWATASDHAPLLAAHHVEPG